VSSELHRIWRLDLTFGPETKLPLCVGMEQLLWNTAASTTLQSISFVTMLTGRCEDIVETRTDFVNFKELFKVE
jgi:hypothetical protein